MRDAVWEADTRGRIRFNEDAIWLVVEGCSPDPRSVSVLWIDPDSRLPSMGMLWRGPRSPGVVSSRASLRISVKAEGGYS